MGRTSYAANLAVLLSLAACGGVDASARLGDGEPVASPSQVHFLPGEHMEWEVRWAGVLVGRVQLGTGAEGALDGHPAMVVRSRASSDGALSMLKRGSMELTTWIDLRGGQPLAQAGSFDEIYSGEFLGTRMGAVEWPRTPWMGDLGNGVRAQSSHSMLGLVRGWQPEQGERTRFYVRLRQRLVRVDLVARARERVSSVLGRRSARRLDGLATPVGADLAPTHHHKSYPLALWIDDGAERVPVRIRMESGFGGTVEMSLVTYDPPGTLTAQR